MIDPLKPQEDHAMAWLDRLGNLEFIEDHGGDRMKPDLYWAALRDHDRSACRIEAAVWWL